MELRGEETEAGTYKSEGLALVGWGVRTRRRRGNGDPCEGSRQTWWLFLLERSRCSELDSWGDWCVTGRDGADVLSDMWLVVEEPRHRHWHLFSGLWLSDLCHDFSPLYLTLLFFPPGPWPPDSFGPAFVTNITTATRDPSIDISYSGFSVCLLFVVASSFSLDTWHPPIWGVLFVCFLLFMSHVE